LIASRITPSAVREKKCERCSLLPLCLPDALRLRRGAAAWFERRLRDATAVATSCAGI
jgi:CRISPR-associated exonuclease Cas4